MSESKKAFVGRLEQKPNKFGETEIRLSLGPQDFEKLEEFRNDKGWTNVTIRTSKEGKLYAELWMATNSVKPASTPIESDLPF